ncbi:hypothetical protein PQX77_015646 [Marasmius sp. AFHP31]|nr:hypothetical protein PQX77_015646 [Marasmius sp. AFHP31]
MYPNSALSLVLPPPPANAPHTINIDETCALFSLEIQRVRDASTAEMDRKVNAIRNEPEREVPRLYRILNRPEPVFQRFNPPPAISPNSSSSDESPNHSPIGSPDDKENQPPVFVTNHGGEDGGLHLHAHRARELEALKYTQKLWGDEQKCEVLDRLARLQYSRSGTNNAYQPAVPARKQGLEWKEGGSLANALGQRGSVRRRMPLGDLESSLLPAEKRVIRRPAPASSRAPQFTDPFHDNIPIPASLSSYSFPDIPDIPKLYPSHNVDAAAHQQPIPVPSSPPLLYNSDLGVTSFMTTTYPSELVALHRRRIYPSSTEPDWCVGETIEYVPRRKVFPDALDEPVVTISTLEVAAPRPVRLGQIRETQRWLQRLASDLGAD